jgi:hypothetical protein
MLVPKINHSPLPIAEVKNEWEYTSTSPIRLQDVDRGSFTLCFACGLLIPNTAQDTEFRILAPPTSLPE